MIATQATPRIQKSIEEKESGSCAIPFGIPPAVNQARLKDKRFKRVGRGEFSLKA
jgi:hypothetical protein